jgi:hypothetical protein
MAVVDENSRVPALDAGARSRLAAAGTGLDQFASFVVAQLDQAG